MTAAAARPRQVASPEPLGEAEPAYLERALLACLLSDPPGALQAVKESGLQRGDVSAALGAVLAAARDLLKAGEVVSLPLLVATLKARGAAAPGDCDGWFSFLSGCGLPDFRPEHWAKALRSRALRLRLPAAAAAAGERRAGALQHLHVLVEELVTLAGGAA